MVDHCNTLPQKYNVTIWLLHDFKIIDTMFKHCIKFDLGKNNIYGHYCKKGKIKTTSQLQSFTNIGD